MLNLGVVIKYNKAVRTDAIYDWIEDGDWDCAMEVEFDRTEDVIRHYPSSVSPSFDLVRGIVRSVRSDTRWEFTWGGEPYEGGELRSMRSPIPSDSNIILKMPPR